MGSGPLLNHWKTKATAKKARSFEQPMGSNTEQNRPVHYDQIAPKSVGLNYQSIVNPEVKTPHV